MELLCRVPLNIQGEPVVIIHVICWLYLLYIFFNLPEKQSYFYQAILKLYNDIHDGFTLNFRRCTELGAWEREAHKRAVAEINGISASCIHYNR